MKPYASDLKHFLFANTPNGATSSAVIFSMIQTAVENELDSYRYLTWLMKVSNNASLMDVHAVQKLLLWNSTESCYMK